ncbi:hypothetical protein SeMB42_g07783, partial [Synchytrium endobioticum]
NQFLISEGVTSIGRSIQEVSIRSWAHWVELCRELKDSVP